MNNTAWSDAIAQCAQRGTGYVIATVINTQGSTPRDGGSKMVIDEHTTYDTIGGGQLEFLVVQQARALLAENQSGQFLKPFPLAAEAAQCCGGNVTVMLESFAACDWQIVLFGAGHVSRALLRILAGLPCQVQLIDSRPELVDAPLPDNVRFRHYRNPADAVAQLAPNSWVVIFTHDHGLDYALCQQLLTRGGWPYVGLIGSRTKANRFRKRLQSDGYTEPQLAQLVSPVGLPEVKGKRPMEVAVSIAAQLQSRYYQGENSRPNRSTSWRDIKQLLKPERAAESTKRPVESYTADPLKPETFEEQQS